MHFYPIRGIFAKGVFVILLFLILYTAYNLFTHWRNQNFMKSLKGEIVYIGSSDAGIYKIKANGENNQLIYKNIDITGNHIQWFEEGKIRLLASTSSSTSPGYKSKLIIMDSNGKNVQVSEPPMQPFGDEVSRNKFHEYVDNLFKTKQKTEGITISNGSVYYLAENGKTMQVYDHKFYDFKFNRGPDMAAWSPDKKFLIYNEDGITITDLNGTKKARLPIDEHVLGFDWKY